MDTDKIARIPRRGWILIAVATGIGALAARSLGALGLGAAAFAWEYSKAPCCAGCAQGAGCGGTTGITKTDLQSAVAALPLPDATISGAPAFVVRDPTPLADSDHISQAGPGAGVDLGGLWSGSAGAASSPGSSGPRVPCAGGCS